MDRELYARGIRDMIWWASEDLGPAETAAMLHELVGEYLTELSAYATEQGVILTKPETAA